MGKKSKFLFVFKVRNIVVYRVNLIRSVEKSLAEKVPSKDVQNCLTELESGFSLAVYPIYTAQIRRQVQCILPCSYSSVVTKKSRCPQTLLPTKRFVQGRNGISD